LKFERLRDAVDETGDDEPRVDLARLVVEAENVVLGATTRPASRRTVGE
jgi:hypothetical protein